MKIFQRTQKRRFFLTSIVVSIFTILTVYYLRKPVKYVIYYEQYGLYDISCHNITVENDLPTADTWKFNPVRYSIYFIETSCKGGLDSRQACSIESAAYHNPYRQVYVLFASPLSPHFKLSDTFTVLKSIRNVQLRRIRLNKYVQRTPIERNMQLSLNISYWTVHHSSDFLRFVTLYKFGGIYLDLDVLTVRSFSTLKRNFISRETSSFIGSAAIGMSKNGIGRKFTQECMNELKNDFQPQLWLYNGPYLIRRVMEKICNATEVRKMSYENCKGIQVEPRLSFYPIHWTRWQKLFQPINVANVSLENEKTYGWHYWNKKTRNYRVGNDSLLYHLAKKNCPKVHNLYGEDFGM